MRKISLRRNEATTLGARVLHALMGAVAAVLATVVLMLLLALLVEVFKMPTTVLPASTTVIKIASIFLGVIFTLRTVNSRGILFGALTGIFYIALTNLIFGLIETGLFSLSGIWLDLLLGAVLGGVSGVLVINTRRK